jgi:hypothetical protein
MLRPSESIAGEQPKSCRSAGGNPSNRSLRRDIPDFDGTARAPSVCRAVLVAVLGWHVLRTCVRLCGCAGDSYPSHPASPVDRPHGSEAHGATEPQPRDRKLASVAHWHGPAVRAVRNRRIRHIPDGQRAFSEWARDSSFGRPLPAHSRRLVSLQAVDLFVLCTWGVAAQRRRLPEPRRAAA